MTVRDLGVNKLWVRPRDTATKGGAGDPWRPDNHKRRCTISRGPDV